MTGVETGRRPAAARPGAPSSSASRYGVTNDTAASPSPTGHRADRSEHPSQEPPGGDAHVVRGTTTVTGASGSSPLIAAIVARSASAASGRTAPTRPEPRPRIEACMGAERAEMPECLDPRAGQLRRTTPAVAVWSPPRSHWPSFSGDGRANESSYDAAYAAILQSGVACRGCGRRVRSREATSSPRPSREWRSSTTARRSTWPRNSQGMSVLTRRRSSSRERCLEVNRWFSSLISAKRRWLVRGRQRGFRGPAGSWVGRRGA